ASSACAMTSRRPKPTPWTACASCTTATSARRLPWPRWLRSIEAHLHGHRGRPLHGGQPAAPPGRALHRGRLDAPGLRPGTGRRPHGAETYGFRFGQRLGWVTDSDWYDAIVEDHQAEVMVLHTVLLDERPDLPHLSIPEAARIIAEARPRLAIITHFGMNVWRAHPWEVAEQLTQATGIQVKAARDGMSLEV